jgi:hypothetical protein
MKLIALLFFSATVFAAVPPVVNLNADSIAVIAGYKHNPYQYIYGVAQSVQIIPHRGELWTQFTISPIGTYQTYKETITFCQDTREKLNFTNHESAVFIYERAMHTRGCFDLLRIDVIQKARTAGDR